MGTAGTGTGTALALSETMIRIRAFEDRVGQLYRGGEIRGFVHTSIGQEACAAGICSEMRPDDYLTTTHRGHGHLIAKGASMRAMMAEILGRATGICKGKGGSMHIADPRIGILGANAIVGGGLPLAVGAALSSVQRGQDRCAVAFFGDGAVNLGLFHESVNLAAIWELPVLFACENNLYAEFTESSAMTRAKSLVDRVAAYGIAVESLDGNDVEAVSSYASEALAACREGGGPRFVELRTYRWQGHYEGDPQGYKVAGEADDWRSRDPIELSRRRLVEAGSASAEELDELAARAQLEVDDAVEFARTSSQPAPDQLTTEVFA